MKAMWCVIVSAVGVACLPAPMWAQSTSLVTVSDMQWNGLQAVRLSNGKSEAVIVPVLSSRVVSFGLVGGQNLLWNPPKSPTPKPGEWANWGGEKVWPAPQAAWPLFAPGWPPHKTYDSTPHKLVKLPDGRLRAIGPVMEGFGVRITREFQFDASGAFVVTTAFTKEKGEPRQVAIWNVVQVPMQDAIFVLKNPNTTYKRGFHYFGNVPKEASPDNGETGDLVAFFPTPAGGYKSGYDTPTNAVFGVKNGVGLLLRSDKKEGQYPEGAEGNGFPVTIWNSGADNPGDRYNEMEVMSPLTGMKKGDTLKHVLRFSVHRLSSSEVRSEGNRLTPDTQAEVARLLRP